jgi:EmrB/QacA subfamily drug resistance transporter
MENTHTLSLENQNLEALPAPAQGKFRKWTPLLVLSLALAIIILDTTILNVTLRTIILDLDTTIQKIQWVITAYSLMLAAFTITGGRLGDLFGRKRMFIVGAIVFALGSFITSISTSVGEMIIGEAIIEGIGAALMMPATVSLLRSEYKGRDLAVAFGIWGGIASAASALGPVIGGWLSTNYSWRWAFRVNIFVVILLVLGSMLLHEARDESHKPTIDIGGVVLSALGLLTLVYGFIESSTYGWWKSKEVFSIFGRAIDLGGISPTPFFILLSIALLGLFAIWEERVAREGRMPLVSLGIFKNQQFLGAVLVTGTLSLSLAGLSFAIPVYFQSVLGLDPLHTGFAMFPMSIVILIAAPLSAVLGKHMYPKHIVQIGILMNMLGFFVLKHSLHLGATQWSLAPGFMLFGFGMGLIMGQTNNLALSALPVRDSGEAAGVSNTFRQVGMSLGAAVIGSILLSSLSANLGSGIAKSAAIPEAAKQEITRMVSERTSEIEFGTGGGFAGVPESIREEITAISHAATIEADKTAFTWGIFFGFLSLLFSMRLPRHTHVEGEIAPAGH